MDHTLKSVAKKYHTTKPTINARIKKIEREHPNKQITYTGENHTLYLTADGLELLEQDLINRPIKTRNKKGKKGGINEDILTVQNTVKKDVKTEYITRREHQEIVKLLEEQIALLKTELDAKNLQIGNLTEIINNQTKTLSHTLNESHTLTSQAHELTAIEKFKADTKPTPPTIEADIATASKELQKPRPKGKGSFIAKVYAIHKFLFE